MVNQEVMRGSGGSGIIVDSITQLAPDDAGAIVVCGSHAGTSAGTFALEVPLAAVFFNDGGVGKDRAGIAALDMLQVRGIPAGAVAHTSARIGDAQDAWDNGILSHVNAAARALGLAPGDRLAVVLAKRVMRSGDPVVREVPVADAATSTASGASPRQDAYYRPDLAWIHHVGYAHHVGRVHSAIVGLLRGAGVAAGGRVLDVGCGSAPPPSATIATSRSSGASTASGRCSDEHHRNVTFEADEAVRILRQNGVEAEVRASFGGESLPASLVVAGVKAG